MRRMAVISLLLVVWSSTALAEVFKSPTIEALVCQSDVVAVGTIVENYLFMEPEGIFYEGYTLQVDEVLVGTPTSRIDFICFNEWTLEKPMTLTPGECVITFLKLRDERSTGSKHVDLLTPTSRSYPHSIIRYDAPDRFLFDRYETVLKSGEEVLEVARIAAGEVEEWRAHNPDKPFKMCKVDVMPGGEAYGVPCHGPAFYLSIPEFMVPDTARKSRYQN